MLLLQLVNLHPKYIDLSLGRLLNLLKKLENPHLKLPPVIHIAGTNGNQGSGSSGCSAVGTGNSYYVSGINSPGNPGRVVIHYSF